MPTSIVTRGIRRSIPFSALFVIVAAAGGCSLGQLIGGMAQSAQRAGSHEVPAQYTGMKDKDFAVVVTADRVIQADFPDVVARVCVEVTNRLANGRKRKVTPTSDETQESGLKGIARGRVPGETVLEYQYNHPRSAVMTPVQLAKELGVQRLIYIEIDGYRLSDPGNPYVWSGEASGQVSVFEADGPSPDESVFQKHISVKFPDKDGYGPAEIPMNGVNTVLVNRFIDRSAWLFYDHEEANIIKY
jgi:hypothetical protein